MATSSNSNSACSRDGTSTGTSSNKNSNNDDDDANTMELEQPRRKRKRINIPHPDKPERFFASLNTRQAKILILLPDDLLGRVLEFIGPNYYWWGQTCVRFRQVHKDCYRDNENRPITTSSYGSSVESMSRVKYCFSSHVYVGDEISRLLLQVLVVYAASQGNANVVDYLMKLQPADYHSPLWQDRDAVEVVRLAAICSGNRGQTDVLALTMMKTKFPWPEFILLVAIGPKERNCPKWEVVAWLLKEADCQRLACKKACLHAAAIGSIELMKFLKENDCPRDELLCLRIAVQFGQIELLRWMQDNQFPWNDQIDRDCLFRAAGIEQLEIIDWLRENNPRILWNEKITLSVAQAGSLVHLKSFIKAGCPWDPIACRSIARQRGHMQIVHWIDGNG